MVKDCFLWHFRWEDFYEKNERKETAPVPYFKVREVRIGAMFTRTGQRKIIPMMND